MTVGKMIDVCQKAFLRVVLLVMMTFFSWARASAAAGLSGRNLRSPVCMLILFYVYMCATRRVVTEGPALPYVSEASVCAIRGPRIDRLMFELRWRAEQRSN